MEIVNFSFDLESRYTFWSGITGGLFLALSYFGTDQSQVGRYLSGKNIKESKLGLIFHGLLKVHMKFFILLVGIMVYELFQFILDRKHRRTLFRPILFRNRPISSRKILIRKKHQRKSARPYL